MLHGPVVAFGHDTCYDKGKNSHRCNSFSHGRLLRTVTSYNAEFGKIWISAYFFWAWYTTELKCPTWNFVMPRRHPHMILLLIDINRCRCTRSSKFDLHTIWPHGFIILIFSWDIALTSDSAMARRWEIFVNNFLVSHINTIDELRSTHAPLIFQPTYQSFNSKLTLTLSKNYYGMKYDAVMTPWLTFLLLKSPP